MPNVPDQPSASRDRLVHDFTLRLRETVELATRARGEELIAEIFAAVAGAPRSRLARRELRLVARERRRLLAALTRQFLQAIERATRLRVRKAVAREEGARARAVARAATAPGTTAPARRRPRPRPLPPPPDPEQLKRDAEFARLRALLRPAAEELPPPPPVPPPAPVVQPQRPATPGEFLRTLEKEIQNAVPTLGGLGPERCGAHIAAWAGQVCELRDRLAPEVLAVMRPAIRIFLEHLTELRAALDAHFVDALEPKWHPPDWSVYIEVNRARAEDRPPALSADQLETYHRTMLRALVQPHRRNVPDQAIPVINAAAAFLPADNGQLRSAIRRHSSEWRAKSQPEVETPPEATEAQLPPADEPLPDDAPAETTTVTLAAPDREPGTDIPAPLPAEDPSPATEQTSAPASDTTLGEFDQPWTK